MNPDSIFLPLDMRSPWTSVLTMLHMGELIPKGGYTTFQHTESVAICGTCCIGMYSTTHIST